MCRKQALVSNTEPGTDTGGWLSSHPIFLLATCFFKLFPPSSFYLENAALTGYSSDANTKVYGMDTPLLSISFLFLGMSKTSNNNEATMKKQIRRIHSVCSHVGP